MSNGREGNQRGETRRTQRSLSLCLVTQKTTGATVKSEDAQTGQPAVAGEGARKREREERKKKAEGRTGGEKS